MAEPKDLIQANARELLGDLLAGGRAGAQNEGDWIGPYQLCEPLGQGGFGVVWRARQSEPVRREVAVKLIKLGMDSHQVLSRFQQERQALAEMNHPCIARLLDAGVGPEGTPFFAMELVPGVPITVWCEEHEAPQETRLRLFQQVCEAVHHAHERRIIHRDLKPTNVLVTIVDGRPLPKVIDFGIAKAIAPAGLEESRQITQTHQWLGTPLYMAPEQFEAGCQPDPGTDVYALGVLLYELLTGAPPYDRDKLRQAGPERVKHLIQELVPQRPSKRVRRQATGTHASTRLEKVPADLDWIVMRALEKERDRRYATAAELAAEVGRFLEHQPVLAGPPSISYRAIRWARRYRGSLMAGAAGAAISGLLAVVLPFAPFHRRAGSKGAGKTNSSQATATIAAATAEAPFVNTLGMKFVPVPGTKVLFSIWDTRVRDYAVFVKAARRDGEEWQTQNLQDVPSGRDPDHPVVGVTWLEAKAFCRWLTDTEIATGKLPGGARYRLPTDEEWSSAVGLQPEPGTTPAEKDGKNNAAFPWGQSYPPPDNAGNYMDEKFHATFPAFAPKAGGRSEWIVGYSDGFATTSPVGSFAANQHGLYDISGNVAQWCEDWYDGSHQDRVLRGASWWNSGPTALLLSRRVHYPPVMRGPALGFRCVLEMALAPLNAQPRIPADRPSNAVKEPTAGVSRKPFENSLGMKFLPVPGTGVLFCIHETRQKDFAAFLRTNPPVPSRDGVQVNPGDNDPCLASYVEAKGFCDWLSRMEHRQYRLPTDEEWSIAAGVADLEKRPIGAFPNEVPSVDGHYPWGTEYPPPSNPPVANLGDETLHRIFPDDRWIEGYDDGFATSAPVMSFVPNGFGLYDLAGNVEEWCEDWFDGTVSTRVVRGSCYIFRDRRRLLSSHRWGAQPAGHYTGTGFRCVLVPVGGSPVPPALSTPQPR